MRNTLMTTLLATALLTTAPLAMAVEAQRMDESTNPNSNPDTKTQNLQQKPNAADDSQPNTQPASNGKQKAKVQKLRQAPDADPSMEPHSGTDKHPRNPE